MKNNKLTIGILAHVDAGKTTLSESVLYQKGITRTIGRVDHGDAFLDTHQLEKNRGITIFSKQAVFPLEGKTVTLLDTPGHMDFFAEMERTLQVLDYAVLVISGADNLPGTVRTLWNLLERYKIPVFIFINKMDLPQANPEAMMKELSSKLSSQCADAEDLEDFYEKAALCDEGLLEEYLRTGSLSDQVLAELIARRKLFPCYYGSALKMDGIDQLLKGLGRFTFCRQLPEEFGARVFKITRDHQGNRLTHLKITGGRLQVRQSLGDAKIHQIRIYQGKKYETVQEVEAGTVCAVTGLTDSFCGQGLGFEDPGTPPYLDSVLTYQVLLPPDWEIHDAYIKFLQLEEELPELHVAFEESTQSLRIRMMGEIQGEILKSLVKERFDREISFGSAEILYRETIGKKAEGVGHFEPLRHYAEVHLLLTPLPAGSGLELQTDCSEDVLDRNWQRLILTHLRERQHPGVLTGSPITDMRITLVNGKAHVKHTEGGDFRQATYRAIRHGLRKASSVLLEPYYEYCLEIPADLVGKAMHDIQNMSGTCRPPENSCGTTVLTGQAPVSEMNGYHREVSAYSRGQGRLYCSFCGFLPCHDAEKVIAAKAYDPDRDPENPCGSVFCRHGAGELVPWDEVEDYMDLPLSYEAKNPKSKQVSQRQAGYSDEELEEIFRQTYGLSKREKNRLRKSAKIISADHTSAAYTPVRKAYNDSSAPSVLLIDGYNMIFAWEELKDMAALSLESARDLLLEILNNYQGYTGESVIVVFDAYKQPGNPGTVQSRGSLQVVYTREAETADQYIEKFVLKNVKKLRITVATSDALEQMMIFGQGALRMSARELRQKILDTNEEIRTKFLGK